MEYVSLGNIKRGETLKFRYFTTSRGKVSAGTDNARPVIVSRGARLRKGKRTRRILTMRNNPDLGLIS